MLKKVVVGAGAAGILSAGVLVGGLTTGLVGAQTPHQQAAPAQATPAHPAEAPEAETQDAPVSLPAGSVTADQAKQAAVTYVQQTAPYNTQGLQVQAVQADDENGTVVYKVTFTGSNGQGAEVSVSTQGTVLKAESDSPDANEQSGAETPDANEQPGAGGATR